MLLAGVDGTKAGWVVVESRDGEIGLWGASRFSEVLDRLGEEALVAVDMPIGFSDRAVRGGRECERLARAAMPGRASSVFGSPCRAALAGESYDDACQLNRASSEFGLAISKQAHALFPKMREIDAILTPGLQVRVFEVHPELCFATLAAEAGTAIRHGKKEPEGWAERIALLGSAGFPVDDLLAGRRAAGAQADDVLDAAVACWTARRRALGQALRRPEFPPQDKRGLFMEMWA